MIRETIEKGYTIFAGYNPERPLDICTHCCMSPEHEAALAAMEVRQIPEQLLAAYNDGARSERTAINETKHFLPRYLELISLFRFPSHSTELSLTRLLPYEKTRWTAEEQNLMREFSQIYFRHCLDTYPLPFYPGNITSILIMFSGKNSGLKELFPVSALLEIWEATQTVTSVLHFRDLYFYGFDQHHRGKMSNPFGDPVLASQLNDWLEQEKVRHHFQGVIEYLILKDGSLEESDASDLSLLYEQLIR